MLTLLKIRNIAVVEAADICFDKGFSVLSGETGAGKSMIIDAVRMILGERMSRDIIRTGEKKASVYAEFSFGTTAPSSVENFVDSDGKLILYREISSDGKNVCRINDKPVQTSLLRTIGEKLVDIHGQHDSRNLLDPDRHIEYIDIFAGLEDAKQEYRKRYAELRSIAREIKALQIDEGEKLRRIEMLDYQIMEIENANLSAKEEDELTERKALLTSSEKLASRITSALESRAGGDRSAGAVASISDAIAALQAAARIHSRYESLAAALEEASYAVEDVLRTLESEQEELVYSPEELNTIEERLDLIYRLKRKYGPTVPDVLDFLSQIQEERNTIAFSDQRREELTNTYRAKRHELLTFAQGLSEKRHSAAEVISQAIEAELAYLNMPNTRFSLRFQLF